MKLIDRTRVAAPTTELARMVTVVIVVAFAWSAAGSVLSAEQLREANQSIEKHRKGVIVIEAPPGTDVVVEQVKHEFWFGAAVANSAFDGGMKDDVREKYLATFLENFNCGVTENALKWKQMEPRRGRVDYKVVDAILDWGHRHDVPLRGHNIYWGTPNFVQDWLKQLSDEELEPALKTRALDVASRYKGRFAEYDLNNEMVHGNYYEQRLGKDVTAKMASWVREGDPKAVLYLNDYNMLTGRSVDRYVQQIRGLLDQKVPLGGIGVQGHSHGDTFDPAVVKASLDKLASFGLPIRITEFNMPGQASKFYKDKTLKPTDADYEASAQLLVDYYRLCFAHPQVEGVLMWGFWEGANWIPSSSMYARDWTPRPAAKAYRDLVFGEWRTKWNGKTDAAGRCEVKGFYGKYRLVVGGKERVVELRKSTPTEVVTFR